MIKVAILDDNQNVAQDFVDLKKLSGKYEIEIFNEWFESEEDAIDRLKDFEDRSVNVITMFHFIEHIEHNNLLQLTKSNQYDQ